MRATEIDQFETKYGYKPTQLRTSLRRPRRLREQGQPAREAHPGPGRRGLLQDPAPRRQENVTTWGQLGLTGDWAEPADQPLRPQLRLAAPTASSRSTRSATATTRTPSRSSPARPRWSRASPRTASASATRGIGYKTSGVKVVPLAEKEGGAFSDGNYEDVKSGKYPLNRFLYVYINQAPGQAARSRGQGVREAHPQQGGPGGRGQGRLPAAPAEIVKQELAKLE